MILPQLLPVPWKQSGISRTLLSLLHHGHDEEVLQPLHPPWAQPRQADDSGRDVEGCNAWGKKRNTVPK